MSKLQHLLTVFGSRMKAQEILLLMEDKKQVVRQGFYPHELIVVKEACANIGLFLVESKFTVALDEPGFANRGLMNQGLMKFYYMSKDELLAYKAAHAEQVQDHVVFGRLLGYPDCCIQYFVNAFRQGNVNPEIKPLRWETNVTCRNGDWVVLSHFPCSAHCTESIGLAHDYFKTIYADDEKWATKLQGELE